MVKSLVIRYVFKIHFAAYEARSASNGLRQRTAQEDSEFNKYYAELKGNPRASFASLVQQPRHITTPAIVRSAAAASDTVQQQHRAPPAAAAATGAAAAGPAPQQSAVGDLHPSVVSFDSPESASPRARSPAEPLQIAAQPVAAISAGPLHAAASIQLVEEDAHDAANLGEIKASCADDDLYNPHSDAVVEVPSQPQPLPKTPKPNHESE